MPSHDWDDSWYDDDEFPPLRKRRGRGGVVFVAVSTFIMCAFNALSASCLLLCGIATSFMGAGNAGDVPLPADLLQHAPLLLLGFGTASAVSFVTQIVAGIGLVNGRSWSRTASFYLAGYSTVTAIFLVYLTAKALTNDFGNPDENMAQAISWIIGLTFHGGYALTVFLVLSIPRVAASLR
jgi:hypothetical protein